MNESLNVRRSTSSFIPQTTMDYIFTLHLYFAYYNYFVSVFLFFVLFCYVIFCGTLLASNKTSNDVPVSQFRQ